MDSTWFNVPENLHHLVVGSLNRDRNTNQLIKKEFKTLQESIIEEASRMENAVNFQENKNTSTYQN